MRVPDAPLVSIIVNNHNYERFLAAAIDSALEQRYPRLEVIVVDDGSTDDSHAVIARYGARVQPLYKDNGGQASALNAGFAASHGDIVIFLDADDVLHPDTAARVVRAFAAHPESALVQYRLQLMDEHGTPTARFSPPAHVRLPNEDLRQAPHKLNNNTWWAPMSGNAFAGWVLREVMPIPPFGRLSADYYLARVSALCAPVCSLEQAGGYYRFHGDNNLNADSLDLGKLRTRISRLCTIHQHIHAFAAARGLAYPAEARTVRDVMFLAERLTSRKLADTAHPIHQDTHLGLCWRGILASFARADAHATTKLVQATWFVAMTLAPVGLARWLAEQLFYAHKRRTLGSLLRRPSSPKEGHVRTSF